MIGAGPAGLGAAALIERQGVPALVLERGEQVGTSWRGRYEGLRLNTPRIMSTPPVHRMPRRLGRYPTREDLVAYLEEYVERTGLTVRCGVEATRVDPDDGGWRVETSDGAIDADNVVVAAGYDRVPCIPDWPGRDGFTGDLLHAAEFRSAEPYRGRDVLVVACGNTGSELATFVARAGARRVRVSMRTPPNLVARDLYGMPMTFTAAVLERFPPVVLDTSGRLAQWLLFGNVEKKLGIPPAPQGVQTTLDQRRVAPLVDDGFVEEVERGRIELVGAVEGFDGADVLLAGGERIQPEVVIAATGYHRGLEPLVGHLGVVGEWGEPVASGAPVPGNPGLWFTGYTVRLSGQLHCAKRDSRRIARAIARARRVASAAA